VAAAALGVASGGCAARESSEGFIEVRRYDAPAARQAVAVDAEHFFAISNRVVERFERGSGALVRRWQGPADGPVVHLNSGVVLDGVLYCAHSNYPAVPMRSSIERFDAETLRHLGRRLLPDAPGSATWVDRHDGAWWVGFAHYAGRGGVAGKGPEATTLVRFDDDAGALRRRRWCASTTTLVRFDDDWRAVGSWRYPASVVERFGRYSSSGGAWGPGGLLYVTGHDAPEVYALRLPEAGFVLDRVAVLPAPIAGQGIAFDPRNPASLWGIVRRLREVRVMEPARSQQALE
jgi:hypothetical protein